MARKREVVLGFATKNLETAEGIAKRVVATVKQAQGVTRETVADIRSRARDAIKEARALKEGAIERDRLAARAGALKDRALSGLGELQAGVGRAGAVSAGVNALHGAAGGLKSPNISDKIDAAADVAGMIPDPRVRAAVTVVKALVVPLIRHLEKKEEELRKAFVLDVNNRIERMSYELDYARKMREDPAFANAEAKRAFNLAVAEERAMSTGGWHESADFLESFGG